MKGKTLRRGLISLLMAAVLVMGSMTVFAADSTVTSVDELKAAISSAGTGDTIVLGADLEIGNDSASCIKIETGKDIILDLNGHSITQKITDRGYSVAAIAVRYGATLTVQDNSNEGTGKISATVTAIQLEGTLNLESGTLACDATPSPGDAIRDMDSDGNIDSLAYPIWVYIRAAGNKPVFNMTGGQLLLGDEQKTYECPAAVYFDEDYESTTNNYSDITIKISGGYVEGDLLMSPKADIQIAGGTYSEDISVWLSAEDSMMRDDNGDYVIAVELSTTAVLDGVEVPDTTEVVNAPKGYIFTEADIEELKDLDLGDEDIEFVALAWDKEGTDVIAAGDVLDADATLYIILKTVETTPAPTPTPSPTPAPDAPGTTPTPESPKTGDTTPVGLYIGIIAAAAVAVGGFRIRKVTR